MSWKDGVGSLIHLWRDPTTGEYGLRQFERPDGTYGHVVELDECVRPEPIKDHGTAVILCGNSEEQDTMQAPEGAPSPSRWVAKYLNGRYCQVPEGIVIRAREGWEHPREDKDRNLLRTVIGQAEYLRCHASSFGTFDLSGAGAHWWVLKNEPALTQNSGWIESSGHIAALYQHELYELATGRRGRALLQNFGVIFGHSRVVIYVEPFPREDQQTTTNTARTHLLIDSEPLPWSDWAADFRDNIPAEIQVLMDEVAAGSTEVDRSKAIQERLKQIMNLFRVSRYRPTPKGELRADPNVVLGGLAEPKVSVEGSVASGRPGREGGKAGGIYSVFLKDEGPPATKINPDVFPKVRWISVEDNTREPGDIEDRAARFLLDQNTLLINADFRVFTDMIEHWSRQFGNSQAVRAIVKEAVHGWYEQTLVETVIGVQCLKDSFEWSVDDVYGALLEEALTTAVMARYHVNNAVKRELGAKLGRLPKAA